MTIRHLLVERNGFMTWGIAWIGRNLVLFFIFKPINHLVRPHIFFFFLRWNPGHDSPGPYGAFRHASGGRPGWVSPEQRLNRHLSLLRCWTDERIRGAYALSPRPCRHLHHWQHLHSHQWLAQAPVLPPLAKQIPLLVLLDLLTLSECGRHYYPDGANRFSTV